MVLDHPLRSAEVKDRVRMLRKGLRGLRHRDEHEGDPQGGYCRRHQDGDRQAAAHLTWGVPAQQHADCASQQPQGHDADDQRYGAPRDAESRAGDTDQDHCGCRQSGSSRERGQQGHPKGKTSNDAGQEQEQQCHRHDRNGPQPGRGSRI